MKCTTEVMHRRISRAVAKLRYELRLGQAELATALGKCTDGQPPTQVQISRWERGEAAPSPAYRAALALLAEKQRKVDLADLFRAQTDAWRLVAILERLELITSPVREQID